MQKVELNTSGNLLGKLNLMQEDCLRVNIDTGTKAQLL